MLPVLSRESNGTYIVLVQVSSIIHRPSMVAQGFQRVKPLNGRQLHSQRTLDLIDEAIGYY